jgi:hypothetical protein
MPSVPGLLRRLQMHSVMINADRCPDDVRLSDLEPLFVRKVCGHRSVRPLCDDTRAPASKGTGHETPSLPPLPRPTAPLVEMAKAAEAVQDGRICIELINPPILDTRRGRSTLGNECGPRLVDS